jgi:hypothetical protein
MDAGYSTKTYMRKPCGYDIRCNCRDDTDGIERNHTAYKISLQLHYSREIGDSELLVRRMYGETPYFDQDSQSFKSGQFGDCSVAPPICDRCLRSQSLARINEILSINHLITQNNFSPKLFSDIIVYPKVPNRPVRRQCDRLSENTNSPNASLGH